MSVVWTQTRHFPKRICWVGLGPNGEIYPLRLTEVSDRHAHIELKRTDDGGSISDRRDGWATEVLIPEAGLDALKYAALEWAANVIARNV